MIVRIFIKGDDMFESEGFSIRLEDFPTRMNVGDILHLNNLVDLDDYTEGQTHLIQDYDYEVSRVIWTMDDTGYLQEVETKYLNL